MVKKTTPDELIGFKDFIEERDKKQPKISRTGRDSDSSFELLSFLERESDRLAKIIDICEEKSRTLSLFPHDSSIVAFQETDILENRIHIVEMLKQEDSPFIKNLDFLFKTHFSS